MGPLLHTGHEPLLGELVFLAAGVVIAAASIWYGAIASRRRTPNDDRRKAGFSRAREEGRRGGPADRQALMGRRAGQRWAKHRSLRLERYQQIERTR